MKRLFLTDNPLPMKKYIIVMACISLFPSLLAAILLSATGLFGQIGPDVEGWKQKGVPVGVVILDVLVIGPLVETLLMALIIFILSLGIKSQMRVAIASAILWGILHSLVSPAWGLIVWWPFFIFSCAYLTWRQQSWRKGYWAAAAIHFLQNSIPAIGVIAIMI
jgi:membrane protease YdiL (CAAX protease family)